MIRFGEDVCRNLDFALRREWPETNGIDGFASGTIGRMQYTPIPRACGRCDQAAGRPIRSAPEA